MEQSEHILRLKSVTKTYTHPVLHDVSINLDAGESVALVGANGAGKSTLIKIILGLVRPTAGEGQLFGQALGEAAGRLHLGYLPEKTAFWAELNAEEILNHYADLRGLGGIEKRERVAKLLQTMGLSVRGQRSLATYSKGMLQRVGIALALLHDPDFLILDEPMSGLDPRAQEKLRHILLSLRRRGKSLLISSHALDDVRLLCDRVIVLEMGHVVADGPTEQVLGELSERYRSSEPWDEDPLGEWEA